MGDVELCNKLVEKILKENVLDLYAYVDIGISNLGTVLFAFPKNVIDILHTVQKRFQIPFYMITAQHILQCYPAIWAQNIDLTGLQHTVVSYADCPLKQFHSKELVDRCLHLFQEYSLFKECKRLGLERQPPVGHTDITNLMKREFPDKTAFFHPCSVQAYMQVKGKCYEERKVNFVVESVTYIPYTICPELHSVLETITIAEQPGCYRILPPTPRIHDIADACILGKFDVEHNLLPLWIKTWRLTGEIFNSFNALSHNMSKRLLLNDCDNGTLNRKRIKQPGSLDLELDECLELDEFPELEECSQLGTSEINTFSLLDKFFDQFVFKPTRHGLVSKFKSFV